MSRASAANTVSVTFDRPITKKYELLQDKVKATACPYSRSGSSPLAFYQTGWS